LEGGIITYSADSVSFVFKRGSCRRHIAHGRRSNAEFTEDAENAEGIYIKIQRNNIGRLIVSTAQKCIIFTYDLIDATLNV